MNVCRFGYKRSDGKCALNGKKCRTTCGSNVNVDVEPPTHKDVLLKTWAQDTRVMALSRVHLDTPSGECTVDHEGRTVYYQSFEEALDGEIAYLNSAAEERP